MTRVLILASLIFAVYNGVSQITAPSVQWQRTFGGSLSDGAFGLQQTTDGGYIICGFSSSSTNGNKTSPARGANDCWVVRLDANGQKLWDATYGGNGDERISKLKQTSDGGFVLAGYSTTGTNGTKTSPPFGGYDSWLVRLDESGNSLWDKSYGGTSEDYLETVNVLSGGGFLLTGLSSSGPSGNKTSTLFGGSPGFGDAWLVRVDDDGQKLWDASYGGSGDDTAESVIELGDGGFIVAGFSISGATGNKTSPNYGNFDVWVFRIDSNGNRLWDRSYGGNDYESCYRIVPAGDGYLLGATSASGVSGNKTSPGYGNFDYWIIRLDSDGNALWQKTFGGSGADFLRTVAPTRDGGFVLGGRSNSGVSGNKTTSGYGDNDFWIVRIDSEGNKLWERTVGGNASDDSFDGTQTADGGFIFTGWSYSGINGNKTEPNFGDRDIWVVKLGPEVPRLIVSPQSHESIQANGFRFLLNGIANQYAIEVSSNLADWNLLQTNSIATTGWPIEVIDWGATNGLQRAYRARLLP